jgi:nucleoside-diphosphate-sugar epimerase
MANYLVSGAAGFIASRVSEMLLANGHTVVGIDNMNDAYDVRMKEHRLSKLLPHAGFVFYRDDISRKEVFMPGSALYSHSYDAVINLAARAGVRQSVLNPWVYLETNITGTLNLLEFCKEKAIAKFVLASTSSVYGPDAPLPTPETADSDHPLQSYAATKKGAEVLCHSYHHLVGIDVTVVRYFTVYGPAPRPDMVMFRFLRWISDGSPVQMYGDGEQSRGFTYLDDIARGTILALKPAGYEIINLGGHEVIKINDLVHLFEKLTGRNAEIVRLPRHPADMLTNWANTQKAERLLGWEPQVSLSEGISHLLEWYIAERAWASQINI